jgi:hypothetical protein
MSLIYESIRTGSIENIAYDILEDVIEYSTDEYYHTMVVLKQSNPELVSEEGDDEYKTTTIKLNIPFAVLRNNENPEKMMNSMSRSLRSYGGPGQPYSNGYVEDMEEISPGIGRFTIVMTSGLDI